MLNLHMLRSEMKNEMQMFKQDEEAVASDPQNRIQFALIITASLVLLDMTPQELGDYLHVSGPSIEGWTRGRNLPFRGIQPKVYAAIGKLVDKKIALLPPTVAATEKASEDDYERVCMMLHHGVAQVVARFNHINVSRQTIDEWMADIARDL